MSGRTTPKFAGSPEYQFSGSEFGRTLVRPAGPAPGMVLAIPRCRQKRGPFSFKRRDEDLVRTLRLTNLSGTSWNAL